MSNIVFVAGSMAGLLLTLSNAQGPEPKVADNKELTRRFIEILLPKGDLDRAHELVSPEYRRLDLETSSRGPALVRGEMVRRHAVRDLSYTVDELVGEGEKVFARFTVRGVFLGSAFGQPDKELPIKLSEVMVVTIREGRIVDSWRYTDMGELKRQLGFTSLPPQ